MSSDWSCGRLLTKERLEASGIYVCESRLLQFILGNNLVLASSCGDEVIEQDGHNDLRSKAGDPELRGFPIEFVLRHDRVCNEEVRHSEVQIMTKWHQGLGSRV